MATIQIELPYGLTPAELVIEDDARGRSVTESREWLYANVEDDSDEYARIVSAAAVLHLASGCTFGEALDTAITWERG